MFNRAKTSEEVLVSALADAIRAIVRDELAKAERKPVKAPVFEIGMPRKQAAKVVSIRRPGKKPGRARGSAKPNHDRMSTRRFDHHECCELFLAGVDMDEIAARFDVTKTAVRSVLVRNGYVTREFVCGRQAQERVIALRREGKSLEAVAKEAGVGQSVVTEIVKLAVMDGTLPAKVAK